MEMSRQPARRNILQDRIQHLADGIGRSCPNRVAKRNFITAEFKQLPCNVGDFLRRCRSVIGTICYAGHITTYRHAIVLRLFKKRLEPFDAFSDRAVDVFPGKPLRRRPENRNFVRGRLARRRVALDVRCQHRIDHGRMAVNSIHDVPGIGHLRHPFGADKTRHLDFPEAAV